MILTQFFFYFQISFNSGHLKLCFHLLAFIRRHSRGIVRTRSPQKKTMFSVSTIQQPHSRSKQKQKIIGHDDQYIENCIQHFFFAERTVNKALMSKTGVDLAKDKCINKNLQARSVSGPATE